MPPLLLPLLGVIALAIGLFGKRGASAILQNLDRGGDDSPSTKTEIHNHYYQGTGPRTGDEPKTEARVRRRARRAPPVVIDENPYDEDPDADGGDPENEVNP
jgi:hypothetical protein